MGKKEIDIICEKCNKKYVKGEIDSSIAEDEFIGGYCNKCSEEYQMEKHGRIIEKIE